MFIWSYFSNPANPDILYAIKEGMVYCSSETKWEFCGYRNIPHDAGRIHHSFATPTPGYYQHDTVNYAFDGQDWYVLGSYFKQWIPFNPQTPPPRHYQAFTSVTKPTQAPVKPTTMPVRVPNEWNYYLHAPVEQSRFNLEIYAEKDNLNWRHYIVGEGWLISTPLAHPDFELTGQVKPSDRFQHPAFEPC